MHRRVLARYRTFCFEMAFACISRLQKSLLTNSPIRSSWTSLFWWRCPRLSQPTTPLFVCSAATIILWPAIQRRLLTGAEAVKWLKSQPHQSYLVHQRPYDYSQKLFPLSMKIMVFERQIAFERLAGDDLFIQLTPCRRWRAQTSYDFTRSGSPSEKEARTQLRISTSDSTLKASKILKTLSIEWRTSISVWYSKIAQWNWQKPISHCILDHVQRSIERYFLIVS